VALRIYVAGEAPNSLLAVRNLQALCTAHCGDAFSIDVVDVLLSPERAWDDGVIVTPMTVRLSPAPAVQLIGNLSNTKQVLQVLGLTSGQV
jgi:circadian clock protein KaiB